ncbi:MAG: sugar ABC transporter permease [Spirochaetaceae bacterium]|nr:MAG: sugar ABC transporter permease [Spirochaetaceae bacterium]
MRPIDSSANEPATRFTAANVAPGTRLGKRIRADWELYLLLLPTLIYFLVFHYGPMYGIQLAFKDFRAVDGIWGSPWAGARHFLRLFNSYQFPQLVRNTLGLSLYALVGQFPVPIILAILLNHVPSLRFKRIVQTTIYAPHFISTVVLVGLLFVFLSPRSGMINVGLGLLGRPPVFFMADPRWFPHLYVFSGVWQSSGWSSIIYLAALSSVDPGLYEAAEIDGATTLQKIVHVDIPTMLPTAVILLIIRFGQIMSIGFEQVFLMQTASNIGASEIIATYVYKVGIVNAQFSFATAVGLFNAVINLILIIIVNRVARAVSSTGLW